jgi:hypothetical protein
MEQRVQTSRVRDLTIQAHTELFQTIRSGLSEEAEALVRQHTIYWLSEFSKSLRGKFSAEHLVQVFCYCKFWRLRTSLLVDFGKQSLIWKRLLYRSHSANLPEIKPPEFVGNPGLAASIIHAVGDCLNETGLGYRQTTWKGLVNAAIQSAGHKVHINPTAMVLSHPGVTIASFVIEDTCALLVTALNDGINATDRAILQTHLRWLNLDWGIVFHFGKTTADLCFVRRPLNEKTFSPADSGRPTD